jgi:uncharacterized membrane protein SpoIIM required for sporulation
MVLEGLLTPRQLETRPEQMFLVAFFSSLLGICSAYLLFPQVASFFSLVVITILTLPLMRRVFEIEEVWEEEAAMLHLPTVSLIRRHGLLIKLYLFLFLGVLFAFILTFILLPKDMLPTFFKHQIDTIEGVRALVAGHAPGPSDVFLAILYNNLRVLLVITSLSLLLGAGAILEICWNASVLAVAIGNSFRKYLLAGFPWMHALPLSLGTYLLHGIIEMVAYFIGAIAGGILSVVMIRYRFHRVRRGTLDVVLSDFLILLLISIALLAIGASVETMLLIR